MTLGVLNITDKNHDNAKRNLLIHDIRVIPFSLDYHKMRVEESLSFTQ